MGSKKLKITKADRISNLPDSVLVKILDLLPTKTAVRTSILAKRWRPLCMSLANLNLCDRFGNKSGIVFSNFVDRFLMHRPDHLKIENFELNCNGDYGVNRVDEWIRNAVGRELKRLVLCFSLRELYQLMEQVYVCASLEVLRLTSKILVDIPEEVNFSRLRDLHFRDVTFLSYESVGELLLNCPMLEELSIEECEWLSGYCLSICGSALKNLSLINGSPVDQEFFLEILIDTPALETLNIEFFASDDILIKENLQFLKTASIDVEQIIKGALPSSVFGDCVFGLLKKINHVKYLSLGGKTVEAFNSVYENDFRTVHDGFPPFHNLTELDLSVEVYCGKTLLEDFLENSPNLQSLMFPQGLVDTSADNSWSFSWGWPQSVPECLSTHLHTVHIAEFRGTDDELLLVEYLLHYGSALRNVSIYSSNFWDGAEVEKELLTYHRESANCRLFICF